MSAKKWILTAIGVLLCYGVHAQQYKSETIAKMSFKLDCNGKTFYEQDKCELTVTQYDRRPFNVTFQSNDMTLSQTDPNLMADVSRRLESRASNRYQDLPALSEMEKDELLKFKDPDTQCFTGNQERGASFIWCSPTNVWPKTLAFFVVGMGAIPMLMFKEE